MGWPLFVYGTLLDAAVLAAKSGDPRLPSRARPAWVDGMRRVAFRGTPYPTLLPGVGRVAGRLVRPTPAALRRLAVYEGPAYRLHPLRVTTPRGPVRARAWMVARRHADPAKTWKPAA
ncbi:gamma-glutamylcyclotransferase family protein [Humitalea sp. 24SJ18S-53]|uniref:gamma-glutamylcyclotransferase family protein n=1 Tax=Humitalea sp. 24SJ18S-53 TaxID=3422307 RepID=UPI003D672D99